MPIDMELQVIACLLRQGRAIDQLSTGLMLLGVLFGLLQLLLINPVVLILSAWLIIVGLLQKYWAVRVAFDADLFELMSRDADALSDRTVALDHALKNLCLQPATRASRPWGERQKGALKLLRNQTVLLCAQVLPTLVVILASPWLPFAG
jgi:hypothetical protein